MTEHPAAADFYDTLPRKRMAAGVVYLDTAGRLLIVKPVYRPEWLLPGGTVDQDESPRDAALRETLEELSLTVSDVHFLCVDYMPRVDRKSDSLQFIFYGGVLEPGDIERIRLPAGELSEFRLLPVPEAVALLHQAVGRRLGPALAALRSGVPLYLEGGKKVARTR